MTAKNRSTLKGISENGDTADANLFTDLIDSAVNLVDTTAQSMASELKAPTFHATTEISAAGHKLAASAVTLNVPTTVQTSTRSSADALVQITVNGTVYWLAAYTSG